MEIRGVENGEHGIAGDPRSIRFGATVQSQHVHAAYQSIVFETDEPMHPERLTAFLDGRPDGVFRIKGYVHFGRHGDRELQVVGSFLRFRPTRSGRKTSLVLIGVDMSGLEEQLVGCLGEGDEQAMFAVHRHTES